MSNVVKIAIEVDMDTTDVKLKSTADQETTEKVIVGIALSLLDGENVNVADGSEQNEEG